MESAPRCGIFCSSARSPSRTDAKASQIRPEVIPIFQPPSSSLIQPALQQLKLQCLPLVGADVRLIEKRTWIAVWLLLQLPQSVQQVGHRKDLLMMEQARAPLPVKEQL